MAPTPKLAYAQARLQARYGERLAEPDWRRLEAARSPAHFLELARSTALAPWAALVAADMDPHAIERRLRAAWRDTVEEVAAWLPERWRGAVLLFAMLPELPIRDHVARGQPRPLWLDQDDALREVRAGETERSAGETNVGRDWLARWRALRPALPSAETKALDGLALRFFARFEVPNGGMPEFPYRPARSALESAALRAFRRHAGTPVAVFAYLLLATLDFERFRGALAERKLFATPDERSAA